MKRFVEPLLAGTWIGSDEAYDDDLRYVRGLGLNRPGCAHPGRQPGLPGGDNALLTVSVQAR